MPNWESVENHSESNRKELTMAQREYGYKNVSSENGTFSCHVRKEVNNKLDIYCRINGFNKTAYVNNLIESDMNEKFNKLREDEN